MSALVVFALVNSFAGSRSCLAVSCQRTQHGPQSSADKAYLEGKFSDAESLYHAQLLAHPDDVSLTVGLVHALLDEQKVIEADSTVKSALVGLSATTAAVAPFITLRGEVELREGEPWTSADSATESYRLDPCQPRVHLLLSTLASVSSMYAMAHKEMLTAHALDPEDPDIRLGWIYTLPLERKITELELYLKDPSGLDADEKKDLNETLDWWKSRATNHGMRCRLVTEKESAEIPFQNLMEDGSTIRAFGLDVKVNNHTAHLQIDTGAGGILLSHSVGDHAGLHVDAKAEIRGIGDEGNRLGYSAIADDIKIGELEFKDCEVAVMGKVGPNSAMQGSDGLIGMDVFSKFLVTLDFPMRKLLLGALPPRPGQSANEGISLSGGFSPMGEEEGESGMSDGTTSSSAPRGPFDRYIAPEMKDYAPVYRVGHELLLPAKLNGMKKRLFLIDTGAFTTSISPDAAREVTKVHGGSDYDVEGLSGKVNKTWTTDKITFQFADLRQSINYVVAFDNSKISKDTGMEVSGFLGANTINILTIHIDYRDGLVKFEYDPNRGYRF